MRYFSLLILAGLLVCSLAACLGNRQVNAACRRDGGLRIQERVSADGLWVQEQTFQSLCDLCIELVATGQFNYVDFKSPSGGMHYPLAPGYYRASLGRRDDPACFGFPSIRGFAADACLVLTALPGEPQSGYAFRVDSDGVGETDPNTGQFLADTSITYEVIDVRRHAAVATFRQYKHAHYLSRLAGGTLTFDACPKELLGRMDFLKSVFNR